MFSCFDYLKDIGQIVSPVHFPLISTGDFHFIAVAMEKSFHIYKADDLKLYGEGRNHNEEVKLIAATRKCIFTATDKILRSTYRSTNKFVEISLKNKLISIEGMDRYCMAAYEHEFVIYKQNTLDAIVSIETEKLITAICHPPSLFNKVLIAYADGSFDLYNVSSKQMLYSFSGFDEIIYRMVPTTDREVVCFLTKDGRIVFHNVVYDQTLFCLQHQTLVTDMSFREDGPPHVVVALDNGDLLVWDLNTKQKIAHFSGAHNGSISSVHFLPGSNLFVTGGSDNSIKQWVLDPDCSTFIRLFRYRIGHCVPPTAAQFADVAGNVQLITASGGSTVITMNPSLETSAQALSTDGLSRSQLDFPIIGMATTNSHRFCSAATIHEDCSLVYLWDCENKRFAKKALTAMSTHGCRIDNEQSISFDKVTAPIKATCATITRCGNFAVVGSDHGNVEVFITQSARRRGTLEKPHDSPVVFVHVDSMNTRIVSGSEDGTIYFHNFDSRAFYDVMELEPPIYSYASHPNWDLIAIGHSGKVTIIDTATRKIARIFNVPANTMAFSANGKYLFVAEKNPIVHLFDIITSTLIQTVTIDSPVTQFAVHPDGRLIATIHKDRIATRLWNFMPSRITKAEGSLAVSSHDNFIKYSNLPIDKIKKLVNPPRDPLRRPQAAKPLPFFLSALLDQNKGEHNEEEDFEKILEDRPQTKFVKHMIEDNEHEDFSRSISEMFKMDNEDIQQEITALGITDDIDERLIFAKMLLWGMKTKKSFEAIQALLSVFLKEHAYTTSDSLAVRNVLKEILEVQKELIQFLEDDSAHSLCLAQNINRAK